MPQSEIEKHWPGVCRDLNLIYMDTLARAENPPPYADRQTILFYGEERFAWGYHAGHLRQYLLSECAEYVPYEPYPEAPDLDCANYDYQEDAKEDRWRYWYADDVGDIIDYLQTSFGPLEVYCGYLPERS